MVRIKTQFVIICLQFVVTIFTANSQGINWIKLIDNISYPLKENDDGISFSYFNSNYGTFGAYLRFDNKTYELFSDKKIVYGEGKFNISSKTLTRIFTLNEERIMGQIVMTHSSFTSKKYNSLEKNFTVLVEAPYGSELLSYPDKPSSLNYPGDPSLFKTNYIKKKTSGLAILGITLGVGISIGGFIVAENDASIAENSNILSDESIWLIGGGIALLSVSWANLYHYVDDYVLNDYYRQLNGEIIQNWNDSKRDIDRLNRQRLQNWENELDRIDSRNILIRNTVTIKLTF